MTLRLIEHTVGLVHKIGCDHRIGTVRSVLSSRHYVALTLQVVPVGENEALLPSGYFNVAARGRGPELFDVLLFDRNPRDAG